MRLRQISLVTLVLAITVAAFLGARALGQRDARRDSERRAEVAATQINSRVEQGAALLESLRRFMTGATVGVVRSAQFEDSASRWLSPEGVPAAAWIEQVPASRRAAYERRIGHPIVTLDRRGRTTPLQSRSSYLPATLVSRFPPMVVPGVDLGVESGVAAAVARPRTLYDVSATPLATLQDGTRGLYLVKSAQRLAEGIVEQGFLVLFIQESWLRAGANDTPTLQLTVGDTSSGKFKGAGAVRSTFTQAGQRFGVLVPRGSVHGAAALLPWIILASGLVLAGLAGALGVTSARRAKATAEVDRLVTMSPDLIVVSGFDGYFKRVNPAFGVRLGYTEEEALSRPLLEFVHPDDRERTNAKRKEILEGETTVSFENRYACKNGSYRWIEWTAVPVLEERQIYAVGRDITERRQAEAGLREAEERTRALAKEQAALRRVATLVARSMPPDELFAAVTDEAGRLLSVKHTSLARYDSDGAFTIVAWSGTGDLDPPIGRLPLGGKNVSTLVFETGCPARLDDYAGASGPEGVAAREDGVGSGVGTPVIVEGRLWGVMAAYSAVGQALPPETEGRLGSFTELVATAIANSESRAGVARLGEEQAALRRVATLVARGVAPEVVFAAVTEEVGRLLGTDLAGMARYDSSDTVTVLATWAAEGELSRAHPLVPGPWPLEGGDLASTIARTGRPVRIDDYGGIPGRIAAFVRDELRVRASIGSPIVVEGRLWGALFVHSQQTDQPLPGDTEARLTGFTELVATAIANTESRAVLGQLAEQQAALRRVATLVAEGVPHAEVFSALCDEVNQLLDAQTSAIVRLEADGSVTVVASRGFMSDGLAPGTRVKAEPGFVLTAVIETGGTARKEDYGDATEGFPALVRGVGIRSAIGAPIVVEGPLWGVIVIGTEAEHFPDGTENRLEEFTELAATAIANAETRSELTASRARIVATSDETRRRIERDLHDGTQQRLVSLGLDLRLAESALPAESQETRRTIDRVVGELDKVIDELREISRGIHPAILSEGGLGPALRTLARRSAIPVELDGVVDHRLPEPIEVGAYYVVSEALANATKHANASRVKVEAAARGSSVRLSIRDDGIGGADPAGGSGLVGLRDRVEALGGSIEITSPPGRGTHVVVQLPLEFDLSVDEPEDSRSHRVPAGR